jgi:hypothetical protein
MPSQDVRQLLVDYLARAAKLEERPEWYNSISSNCTTNLFYRRGHRVPWWLRLHIFLNGLSARAMYRRGFLDNGVPFKELQSRSDIRERALALTTGPASQSRSGRTSNRRLAMFRKKVGNRVRCAASSYAAIGPAPA